MFLEDYQKEMRFQLAPVRLSEEEIIAYAKVHDPRPIHIDPEAAKKSRFGGIIASGFHTLNLCWGQWVHTKLDEEGVVAGIGMNYLRWHRPVYPDMDLYTTLEVRDIEEKRGGEYGVVHMDVYVQDEDGEMVMEHDALVLVVSRKAGAKEGKNTQ